MATYYVDIFTGIIIIIFGIFYILGGIASIINRKRRKKKQIEIGGPGGI